MSGVTNNKPEPFAWLTTEEQDFRQNASKLLETAISLNIVGGGEVIDHEVFATGESSVVYKVTSVEGTRVVKVAGREKSLRPQALCLAKWAEKGVRTPKVINYSEPTLTLPASVLVMEYVQGPILSDVYSSAEMVRKGITFKLGEMQALCHTVPTGGGYGYIYFKDNQPFGKYPNFAEESEARFFGNRMQRLLDSGTLSKRQFEIARQAVQALSQDIVDNNIVPVLTHNDFRPYNIFATEPPTVFDPNPLSTHPYMCLGLSLLKASIEGKADEIDAWMAGYGSVSPIRKEALRQAMLLRAIGTMHTWHKKERNTQLQKLVSFYKELAG